MKMRAMSNEIFNPYISIDCVLLGFDGQDLKVLLVEREPDITTTAYKDMKLPGRLIYFDEDIDCAAYNVLNELTGIENAYLRQFKAFGSPSRTEDPRDTEWLKRLEGMTGQEISRIVTVAYMSLIRINRKVVIDPRYKARWYPVYEVPSLVFDHNKIITETLQQVRQNVEYDHSILFELLPTRFTEHQLRHLFELLYEKTLDVRNFHKKMAKMEYVLPLEEWQKDVPHRAARYYRFDKKLYNKRNK